MLTVHPDEVEFHDAWVEGDERARWRSASATTPDGGTRSSGSSLIQVPPGHVLPRHTDSAEETIVVLAGRAEVTVGDERAEVRAGGLALVPQDVPHSVLCAGDETLLFAAVYAGTGVVTRYETDVMPGDDPERFPLGDVE